MPVYYVFYEDLTPGPRTFYFTGPIHHDDVRVPAVPQVGDEIEFRHRAVPANPALRAQIRSIETVDESMFRFTADPVGV